MKQKQREKNEKKENAIAEEQVEAKFKIPEPVSQRRLWMILCIIFSTILLTVGISVFLKKSVSKFVFILMIEISFLSIFIYGIEYARLHKKLILGKINKYERIAIVCAVSCGLTFLSLFLPRYMALFLPMVLALGTVATDITACTYIGFLNLLLCLTDQRSIEEMAMYLLQILLAVILIPVFSKKNLQKIASVILVLTAESMALIFSYLEYQSVRPSICVANLFIAGATAYMMQMPVLRKKMFPNREIQEKIACLKIIQESYELVMEIKQYSPNAYEHAQKVSQIAYQCAEFLNLNAPLAMAGGFYYCIGRLEGKPYVKSGVELAVSRDFPEQVTKILYEYNGEQAKPSSRESAVVHIVNCIETEVEKIKNQDTVWDTKMLIYQVFNEQSTKGIYDESGLSINQYLRLRDFLAKKEEIF